MFSCKGKPQPYLEHIVKDAAVCLIFLNEREALLQAIVKLNVQTPNICVARWALVKQV